MSPIAAVPTNRTIPMIASHSSPLNANPMTAAISQSRSRTMTRTITSASELSRAQLKLHSEVLIPRSAATSVRALHLVGALGFTALIVRCFPSPRITTSKSLPRCAPLVQKAADAAVAGEGSVERLVVAARPPALRPARFS